MTVVNIGGTGFIGSALTDQLLDTGEEVICFDLHPGSVNDSATVIEGDVTDYEALEEIITTYDPDSIVHLAHVLTAESSDDPHLATRINCVGTDNVFRVASNHGVDRVVYASSIAAMGSHTEYSGSVTEEMTVPAALSQFPEMSLYGASKQFNEYQAKEYERRSGINTVGIRPTVVFGPGRERGRSAWASKFVTDPACGNPGHISCQPSQSMSLIYRDDVAQLFVDAVVADFVSHPVYLTGGHTIRAGELAELVETVVGGSVTCDPNAAEMEIPADVSHDRARSEFGFTLTPLAESIRRHADAVT